MTILKIRGLKKHFRHQVVLENINIQLEKGEIALISGDNGSGKTTMMRVIAGLLRPDAIEESLYFGSKQIPKPPKIVYLHQTPYLFSKTVRANVEYGLRCCQLPLSNADEAMEWANIKTLENRLATDLSGGEKRRVALARMRALKPYLYLMDEPMAHLDSEGLELMRQLLCNLHTEGSTAIISSHIHDFKFTSHWVLEKGQILSS